MFDHVGLGVSDYARSKSFYEAALAPLGVVLQMEPVEKVAAFGKDGPTFWVQERTPAVRGGLHIAFAAEDHATVDAFHAAGLAAGGRDNGAPGYRPDYAPDYYGAFVIDPDGNHLGVVARIAPEV